MAAVLEEEERFISSRDNFKLPDFCQPATAANHSWVGLQGADPEAVIGDIVENALATMPPEKADAAISRAREILASYKSPKKRR